MMPFSAAAGSSSTLIHRKVIRETTFRLRNNLLSHRWMVSISSRGLMSSSSIKYPSFNNPKSTYPFNKGLGAGNCSRMMSTTTNDAPPFVWPPKTAPWLSKTSPWLMLPPIFESGNNNNNLVYQFYTLGENKLLGLKKINEEDDDEVEEDDEEEDEDGDGDGTEEKEEEGNSEEEEEGNSEEEEEEECWPDSKTKILSSSRGWLALFNEYSSEDMFLSNPLSRRHIKLPSFSLAKHFILSSSNPNDPHFRALITYGPRNFLAFCHPGHSTTWTPLGDRYDYSSCVYSTKQKLFFCSSTDNQVWPRVDLLEAWDLRDPLSPKNIPMPFSADKDNYPIASRSKQEYDLKYLSNKNKFLVVAESSDELFLVTRFVHSGGPHGHYVEDFYYGPKMGFDEGVPYKTVGFDVHKYDPETGSLVYMDRSLGGYAFFIGCNDGLALPAAEFPELKPDSIYYTCPPDWHEIKGGHDVGIFNYQDNTFSSCYYPPDMQSTKSICAPMWFTPTPLNRFPLLVENDDGSLSCASSSSFF